MSKKIKRRDVPNSESLNQIPAILQRIYASRGIAAMSELEDGLANLLPFHNLKDIDKASHRLHTALEKNHRILIVGDYDTDGATSTAVAITALKSFGAKQIEYLVPNRFQFGYGLSPDIVDVASQWRPDLIITVDNGIASVDGVNKANQLGIDVLVTDHHLAADTLPDAVAIINPNQPGCEFPSKNIAGVGVIFYVMLALRRHLANLQYFEDKGLTQPNMAEILDLVALGTVADVVALDKNNRLLISEGLKRIRAGFCRPGIKSLLDISKRDMSYITAQDFGFSVAPRLNAAGRLDDMSLGIACLLAPDEKTAKTMAAELNELNIERRHIEQEMKQEAFNVIKNLSLDEEKLPRGLCLYNQDWHQGVIGIVAGRLKERFHRPVIVFAKGEGSELKGSARSVSKVHIRDLLDRISKRHPELIQKFGGHAMAAGLSLKHDKLQKFTEAFAEEIESELNADDCVGVIHSDGPLSSEELNLETAKLIEGAGPWGQAFPEPLFDNQFEIIEQRMLNGGHLKMSLLLPKMSNSIDAIAFNVSEENWPNYRAQQVLCAYRLDINRFRGREKAQLIVEHLEVISD